MQLSPGRRCLRRHRAFSGGRSGPSAVVETIFGREVLSIIGATHQDEAEQPMRMFLKVQMEVEAANRAIKDGSLPNLVQGFTAAAKPEGVWFTALDGKRTMVAVFDLASPAQIPPLAEPFFNGLNATFEICPAMDAADLQAGLSNP